MICCAIRFICVYLISFLAETDNSKEMFIIIKSSVDFLHVLHNQFIRLTVIYYTFLSVVVYSSFNNNFVSIIFY